MPGRDVVLLETDSRYGEKWEREMMRLSKKQLVAMIKSAGESIIRDEEKFKAQHTAAIAHLRKLGLNFLFAKRQYFRCIEVFFGSTNHYVEQSSLRMVSAKSAIHIAIAAYRAIRVLPTPKERK